MRDFPGALAGKICLPVPGAWVQPRSRKIPHALEQLSLSSRACELQLLSLCATTNEAGTPRACAPKPENPLQWEGQTPPWRVAPAFHN